MANYPLAIANEGIKEFIHLFVTGCRCILHFFCSRYHQTKIINLTSLFARSLSYFKHIVGGPNFDSDVISIGKLFLTVDFLGDVDVDNIFITEGLYSDFVTERFTDP